MKIGIDARFFGPKAKGLGRYTQKLIEELEKNDDQNDYLIFLRQENFNEYQPQSPRFKKILAPWRWYSLGEQIFFPCQLYGHKIDLMHFTHFNAPALYVRPFVITIHDLILQRFPTAKDTFFGRIKYWFKNIGYKIVIRLAAAKAKKIITVSQFVKNDIIKYFGAAEEKITVIYEGSPKVANRQEPNSNREILEKYKIKKPYLLYVGNAYPHKNLPNLAKAFQLLRDGRYQELQLVLVGGEDYFYQKLKKANCNSAGVCFGGGVVFTGFVPDNELQSLYEEAEAYVFPSLCEGFGLPPLEAMSYALPVASSSATCLPEILGEAALYFDALDVKDMAEKIGQIISDKKLRQGMIEAGLKQIEKYSWQKMAKATREIYSR
ncbi:MAG TPA: glycosyltransferase family 1 protein [Candidatus Portnoybacteria bacterium]|nr:glycosyltransferase family 1 protein [Candidatus Portnoybacteria bacterium]